MDNDNGPLQERKEMIHFHRNAGELGVRGEEKGEME